MQIHCQRRKGGKLNNDDLEICSDDSDKETNDESNTKSSNEKDSKEEYRKY